MIAARHLLIAVWITSGIAVVASGRAWLTAVPHPLPEPPVSRSAAVPNPAWDTMNLAGALRSLRDRDPFRLDRKPATARYTLAGTAPPSAAEAQTPAVSRPRLALAGIIGGPPWNALVEGVPGREGGVVLGSGEEVNGIRLKALRGDTAFLTGMDTTWILTRRPWP